MRRRGITFKIFIITTILLVVSALLIYLTLYFMLPGYYKNIKQSRLETGVNELIKAIDGKPAKEALPLMSQFGQEHNAWLNLRDKNGWVYDISPNFMRFNNGLIGDGGFPGIRRQIISGRTNEGRGGLDRKNHMLSVERTIHFAESNEAFTLSIDAPLQPIDEASEVILRFLPYMLIAILLIAIGGAAIYSRLIARPLIGLNNVARRLATLDFDMPEAPLKSSDEIGELSQNLSKLASNLQATMAELQNANAQLKDDIVREREQEAKRREFVATISHELKTPITAVSGQLEAMIGNIGIYRDRDTYLRQSYKIMRDMDKLVHEILDLSKLESRDFLPLMREVDLAELVRESIESMSYLADVKSMQIESSLPTEAFIVADERLMAKAVANIVCNAVQYSGEGERVTIKLAEIRQSSVGEEFALVQRLYKLEVLNTGVQLDEAKLTRLFDPFYRVEQSRSRTTGGSGLGLYIVSKVLDAHGAEYGIANTPEGVKFSLLLQAA
ncbi:two-component sensor histidine kinase [Paenibacillus baekrokdamisoli]|uniref:histidine kinase n=1 Tax=Paenibacillus baekrokdamisoli TaxID=1712516 RepID=A0A3G9JFG2_9BACL|nr:HAMP domain-containing sensor histidine kinase [Paenibacillus baekrokdamisoli]MBB3068167.1 two-component system sensor histidine kinase VanS [Paenibacillus baekrokdamisoli]BBH22788.1 two-component sensor histidine kinase [Paenibacillus baekrokdamisoli]